MATISSSPWRPTPWRFVLLLSVAVSATAAADLPSCEGTSVSALPQDDVAACGLEDDMIFGLGAALYYERKCQTPACMRLYATADAANPNECRVAWSASLRLREGLLAPLYAACAALANPTTAPPTLSPVAPSVPASTARETPSPPPTSSASAATPTDATAPEMVPSSVGSFDGSTASSGSTRTPTSTPTEDSGTTAPAPTTLQSSIVPGTGSAAGSETSPTSSRGVQRTSQPAPQPVVVSTEANGSTQTPLLVGAPVAVVVLLVGIAVRWKKRKQKSQLKDPVDVLGDATDPTNADDDATTDGELTTPYATSADGDSDPHGSNLVSSQWRNEMESTLRDDATLELWRVSAGTITLKRLLGRGSHAFVHLVAVSDGTLLASKRLAIDQVTPKQFAQLVGEAHIVSTLQHRSIVTFAGVAWTSPLDFQVLFEFMEGGDLRAYLDAQPLPPACEDGASWSPLKLQMTLAIAEGLAYAHSFNPPLVHRDLKSRNILLTRDLEAKISDFGVSRFLSDNDTMTTGMGTTRWLAPEVISGGGTYNESCDIYSFGVVLTELDTHAVPLASEMEAARRDGKKRSELWLLQEIAHGRLRPSISSSCPPELSQLAARCLSFNPIERPNALEVAFALRKIVREAGM